MTTSGRQAIRWIERKLNELLDAKTGIPKDRVVLIDTDSVVLDLEDLVKQHCPQTFTREQKLKFLDVVGERVLHPYIAKSYDELGDYMNAFQHKFKMKRENIINSMVSVAKKAYVMEVYNSEGVQYTLENPYMKIMGLQLVKSSMPGVVRDSLRNALPIMLHGTESDMQKYIAEQREVFRSFTAEQIAFPRGISNIKKYDPQAVRRAMVLMDDDSAKKAKDSIERGTDAYILGTPIHVRASLVHNKLVDQFKLNGERQKIVDGDKVKFVYLIEPNPIHENAIAFQETLPEQFDVRKYIDYETMFEKSFLSTIEKMIEPLGWKTEKQNTLEDWFTF